MSTRTTTSQTLVQVNHTQHLQIIDITIRSKKPLKSVDVSIGGEHKQASWDRTDAQSLRANFNPPLDLPPSYRFTLRPHLHRELRSPTTWKIRDITIDQGLLRELPLENGNRTEWRRMFGGTEIVIGLLLGSSPNQKTAGGDNDSTQSTKLPSTFDEIIRICPRFRILVIGKSGVGKSSVINSAFGVDKASISHGEAGKSNIDTEILSDDNDKFVLHDSQGFEPGEADNLKIVQEFIERRSNMPHIKDRLHAIWLCFNIPHAGGRIFETGVEDFLKLKTTGKLGQIPVIAVFTKYDLLVTRTRRLMDESVRAELSSDAVLELVKKEADAILQKNCIDPFDTVVQKQVPYMTVSTNDEYRDTLSKLIELTYHHVRKHVAEEASIVTAIAQRVSPGVKIDGSIAIGIKKYWTGLAASVCFPGKTLEDCLAVIHGDIVAVWTFNDPRRHLYSREFKALMTNMVDDLNDQGAANPNKGLSVGLSMVGAIAGIVSALAGPAAPIIMPIAGCFVLAKWAYDVYQQSHGTLRRLMAYIIDLTLVMQNLFWLVGIYRVPVSRRLIKLAAKAYEESEIRVQVHFEIEKHVEGATVLDRVHRDGALSKIVELIDLYRIDTAEMFELKDKIGVFDITGKDDEPWNIPPSDIKGSRRAR